MTSIKQAYTTRTIFLLCPERLPLNLRAAVRRRELALGEILYHRGDPATAIFAVERGRLTLFSYTSEGKPVPLYQVRPGECVSEAALFAESYCGDVVAEIASSVVIFPKAPVVAAFHEYPILADEFMSLLTKRFNVLRVRLELRTLQSARERILQYLRIIAPPGQTTVHLDRPLKSISDDLGLTHETFYRTPAQLVKDGSIIRKKGALTVRSAGSSSSSDGAYSRDGITRPFTPNLESAPTS